MLSEYRRPAGLNVDEFCWSKSWWILVFRGLDGCCGGLLEGGEESLEIESRLFGGAGADLRGREPKRCLNCSESCAVLSAWRLYRLSLKSALLCALFSLLTTCSFVSLWVRLLAALVGGGGACLLTRGDDIVLLTDLGLELGDLGGWARVFTGEVGGGSSFF